MVTATAMVTAMVMSNGAEACQQPPDTSTVNGDCNDNDANVYPDQNDICPLGLTCKAIFDSGLEMGDDL